MTVAKLRETYRHGNSNKVVVSAQKDTAIDVVSDTSYIAENNGFTAIFDVSTTEEDCRFQPAHGYMIFKDRSTLVASSDVVDSVDCSSRVAAETIATPGVYTLVHFVGGMSDNQELVISELKDFIELDSDGLVSVLGPESDPTNIAFDQ